MNKKGAVFTIVFLLIGFFLFYFLFGHDFLTYWSYNMIETHNFSGWEAFLMANMNIWVIISVLLSSMLFVFAGGN